MKSLLPLFTLMFLCSCISKVCGPLDVAYKKSHSKFHAQTMDEYLESCHKKGCRDISYITTHSDDLHTKEQVIKQVRLCREAYGVEERTDLEKGPSIWERDTRLLDL